MITASMLCERAYEILRHKEEWTYVQGCLGDRGDSERCKNLYNYYWNKQPRTNSMLRPYDEWVKTFADYRCTDCNNFINTLLGYKSNYYSVWSLGQLKKFDGSFKDAPAGTVLIMDGHVGLAMPEGMVMDFYKYEASPRLSKRTLGLWEYAVYLPEVEYYENDGLVDINAKLVKNSWRVGDEVQHDDISVVGLLRDGSTVTLNAFTYTPTKVNNVLCQIAVVYNNFVEYLTVSAATTGSFYAVMVPAVNAADALNLQQSLISDGYDDTSIINL